MHPRLADQLRGRRGDLLVGALLAVVGLCWILLTPPGAGPDEPGHLARAGAVVRWQLDGEGLGEMSLEAYELPDDYLVPEPACYAFDPTVPVDCAAPVERTGATVRIPSRADEYPLWGHLVFGGATVLPGLPPVWWARLVGVAIAVGLVTWSLAALRHERPVAVVGILVALTPMAWGTFALVNPSVFGIAGAIALWSAVTAGATTSRSHRWLLACGWTALALPRRDGLIWATLIVAITLLAADLPLRAWWRRLGPGPQLLVAAATVATVVWGLTNDRQVSRLVAISPVALLVAEGLRRLWQAIATTTARRAGLLAALATAGVTATALVVRDRPGGWDEPLVRAVVGQTGTHLVEAIGVLGWLDTALPPLAVAAWVVALGLLVALAVVSEPRALVVAASTLGLLLVASWVFELYQGNTSGRYWQGRYSLPMLVGVPIVLAAAVRRAALPQRRLAWTAGITVMVVLNVAAWAAARRWGVGTEGSYAPSAWSTVHSPVEPAAVLAVHALATLALLVVAVGGLATDPDGAGAVDDDRIGEAPGDDAGDGLGISPSA